MFFVIGCILVCILAVFLFARRLAPQSELLNAFKKRHSFRNTMIGLLAAAVAAFIVHAFVMTGEEWRESAIIQVEDSQGDIHLFQGLEGEAAIAFEETPKAGREYRTSLLIWGNHENVRINVSKKGEGKQAFRKEMNADFTPFNARAYIAPLSILFKEKGLWRITLESNGEDAGNIVVKVE
ncbi:hypothetical protein [Bacillus sp. Marseille-Q1617]|uniref:hypothetical protein n=1 Tax=Bacillus sp. Marseille-Q1617 TaxID=2736887 RepID=UPI0015885666|nr:hypothetical protein [Bacillus sp. Marseille-Q1617]